MVSMELCLFAWRKGLASCHLKRLINQLEGCPPYCLMMHSPGKLKCLVWSPCQANGNTGSGLWNFFLWEIPQERIVKHLSFMQASGQRQGLQHQSIQPAPEVPSLLVLLKCDVGRGHYPLAPCAWGVVDLSLRHIRGILEDAGCVVSASGPALACAAVPYKSRIIPAEVV